MTGRAKMVFGAVLVVGMTGLGAVQTVDFSREAGRVRRELHASGFGPRVCDFTREDEDAIKSMNMSAARTHDWALINPNERVCDYFHIFPLMHLDAKDPRNYCFGPTDYLLKRTREMGLDIFFRLGTSIEWTSSLGPVPLAGDKIHFNSLIPDDFDKVAETFAGTVRHYNKGWANGFNWNIRYWEIWNEADGGHSMWWEPGNADPGEEVRRAKFVKFFVTCLKRLKSEFPDVKVGGPAFSWMTPTWFKPLLQACREAGVAPDFISWHYYGVDPDAVLRAVDTGRALCDAYGFRDCELILNEWHYLGNYSLKDLCFPTPATWSQAHGGPGAHNGIEAAAFTLATLVRFQTSKLAQAYYYGCQHDGSWGFRDSRGEKYKTFHALKMFGEVVKNHTVTCPVDGGGKGDPVAFAVKSADGRRNALLVVDYRGKNRTLSFDVKGLDGKVALARVLDYTRNLAPCAVDFRDGRLTLEKRDDNSAAFLVTFHDGSAEGLPGWHVRDAKGKSYLGLAVDSPEDRAFTTLPLGRTFAAGALRLTADIKSPAAWAGAPGDGTTLRVGLLPTGGVQDGAPPTIGEFGADRQTETTSSCFALSRDPRDDHFVGYGMGPCRANVWYRYEIEFDLEKGVYCGKASEAETGKAVGSFGSVPFCRPFHGKDRPIAEIAVYAHGMMSGTGDAFDPANAGGVDNLKLEWKAPGETAYTTVFTCDYSARSAH